MLSTETSRKKEQDRGGGGGGGRKLSSLSVRNAFNSNDRNLATSSASFKQRFLFFSRDKFKVSNAGMASVCINDVGTQGLTSPQLSWPFPLMP